MLANVFGKVLHAWARQRLLPTLTARRAPGQIGGLPSQQTVTAIQLLRLHCRVGRQRRISTAAVFVDLRAAFHHMLREYIFTVTEPTTCATLNRIFDPCEFDIEQLAPDLCDACEERPGDVPPALSVFLHDLHKSTWFKLDADTSTSTATERGTRPGSPLADLGFNLLMARMMHQIEAELLQLPACTQGCDCLGVTTPPISWFDDLAIPLAATEPAQMIQPIKDVTSILHTVYRRHGMTMNLESGKTEAVVMYRGPGSAPYRTALFDTEAQPTIVVTTNSHILSLRLVATYRHLGASFTMDADVDLEIKQRVAMARQAFEELKRPIFLNRHIPLKERFQLYSSLVISRLMYGCSIWADVPQPAFLLLESAIIDHQRRMANMGFWNGAHMTDSDFRHHMEIAPFRLTWACQRLDFLQHIGKHGSQSIPS